MTRPNWQPVRSRGSFSTADEFSAYTWGFREAVKQTAALELYDLLDCAQGTGMLEHGGLGDAIRYALAKARGETK